MLQEKIKHLAENIFSEVVSIRRHLHSHPELSFEEYNTSKYVQQLLNEWGIKFTTGWVKTGVIAHIEGTNPLKKVVALRADLDALPILETNTIEYVSKNQGVMHACGHDVHTASLLGTAKILYELRNEFEGTIKLIFQPGEEKLPGGAKLLIEEGGLESPHAELIIGQHVFPEMETGYVGFRKGMYMASTDEIHLTISGKGGHAALPHQYNYTTLAAAQFIVAANQLHESVKVKEFTSVLAFGKILANGATNVIPAEVKIEGTLRTLNEDFRSKMHELLKETALNISSSSQCNFHLDIKKGYPVLYNNEEVTQRCITGAENYLGKDKVQELDLRMTAEDFAYYSSVIPACFYRLGTGNKQKGINSPVHTSTFDIDEEALKTGCGLMAYMAINLLH